MPRRELWVIAYDIADDAVRSRVQHALEPVGERRQKSVFECRLSDDELNKVWRQLGRVIDRDVDSVLAWPISRDGLEQARALGVATVAPYDLPGFAVV